MTGIVLRFDRLSDDTLVALHTHDGRSVAAIVHPRHGLDGGDRRWSLAGDVDWNTRKAGGCTSVTSALGEAAQALGVELGIDVAGYEVPW